MLVTESDRFFCLPFGVSPFRTELPQLQLETFPSYRFVPVCIIPFAAATTAAAATSAESKPEQQRQQQEEEKASKDEAAAAPRQEQKELADKSSQQQQQQGSSSGESPAMFQFAERDLQPGLEARDLQPGDEVEFDIFVERRTGRKGRE